MISNRNIAVEMGVAGCT